LGLGAAEAAPEEVAEKKADAALRKTQISAAPEEEPAYGTQTTF